MDETTRGRFDETWRRTFYPDLPDSMECGSRRPSRLASRHAEELESCGIAQRACGPGRLLNVPFTVVEEKDGGIRQRFILRTYDANELAERSGYEAKVPLKHVSAYLSAVHGESGSTRDFRCGFYGIEIPSDARRFFRYQDDNGSWWELTRLPMGHTCAPELMHTLASVAAGHPEYVREEFAVPRSIVTHVWVDNIRYSGPRADVLKSTTALDELALAATITWKPKDSHTAVDRYEFIGVGWQHDTKTVGLSEKLRCRIEAARSEVSSGSMTAAALESLAGRLLHASAIVGVFAGEFYFALKFFRRLMNTLNRGEKAVDTKVELSGCLKTSLLNWTGRVLGRRRVPIEGKPPCATIFVDASLDGWGGVLVDANTSAMEVVGSRWTPRERKLHINELEALAFERSVKAMPTSYVGGAVTVVVDNTTVQGVARKGACVRSRVLNDAVMSALLFLKSHDVSVSVKWVRSAGNPADLPSRVPVSSLTGENLTSMSLAVRRFLTGDMG
ncbi:hypothetical protein DIPPA_06353 [Diplonema papillatum]|nr:hypothetical protein DIPPA_06353 [Diplonema papillatum]